MMCARMYTHTDDACVVGLCRGVAGEEVGASARTRTSAKTRPHTSISIMRAMQDCCGGKMVV